MRKEIIVCDECNGQEHVMSLSGTLSYKDKVLDVDDICLPCILKLCDTGTKDNWKSTVFDGMTRATAVDSLRNSLRNTRSFNVERGPSIGYVALGADNDPEELTDEPEDTQASPTL